MIVVISMMTSFVQHGQHLDLPAQRELLLSLVLQLKLHCHSGHGILIGINERVGKWLICAILDFFVSWMFKIERAFSVNETSLPRSYASLKL